METDLNIQLLNAIKTEALSKIDDLVELGADIECCNLGSKYSMLTYAIVSGKYQSVRKLIELGANVHKSDNHGLDPMTWAATMLCQKNEASDKIFHYIEAHCFQIVLSSPRNSPKASSFVARINDEQKESSYSRDL